MNKVIKMRYLLIFTLFNAINAGNSASVTKVEEISIEDRLESYKRSDYPKDRLIYKLAVKIENYLETVQFYEDINAILFPKIDKEHQEYKEEALSSAFSPNILKFPQFEALFSNNQEEIAKNIISRQLYSQNDRDVRIYNLIKSIRRNIDLYQVA